MGSRANAVVIESGKCHVYYSHGAAQFMDALMFWGPKHALLEVRDWRGGYEDDGDPQNGWWLDNAWAEGGCCIDLDSRHLILYGGEDIECDILWLETYLRLLEYTWRGWTVEWSWGELAQIARYAGVTGDKLEEIDCKYKECPSDLDWYIDKFLFDIPDKRYSGSSTLSVLSKGKIRAAFTCESEPEAMLTVEGRIGRLLDHLQPSPLVRDDDEFLMGSLHLDFDKREIWVWRTWDNHIDIDLSAYWSGWKLFDCKYHYRKFYSSVPRFIEFVPRSEDLYIQKIRDWVCKDKDYFAPHGLALEERERLFEEVRAQYRSDNPTPRILPEL